MGYEGCCELWENWYIHGEKNGDVIVQKIRAKLRVFPLKSSGPEFSKFGIYKNRDLTTITISEVPDYENPKKYRKLVRVETQHERKIPSQLKDLLASRDFKKIDK